jgi:hypothetical protein
MLFLSIDSVKAQILATSLIPNRLRSRSFLSDPGSEPGRHHSDSTGRAACEITERFLGRPIGNLLTRARNAAGVPGRNGRKAS